MLSAVRRLIRILSVRVSERLVCLSVQMSAVKQRSVMELTDFPPCVRLMISFSFGFFTYLECVI